MDRQQQKELFIIRKTARISFRPTHNIMDNRKLSVLVALQQALLGEVSSQLRAVTVSYDDASIHFDCYYDGVITDNDRESMSRVETEIIALFPENHRISFEIERWDFPKPTPKDKLWAFFRKED